MRSSFLHAITATTALVSLMAGGSALAACAPDPAANGATVTCSGVDSDGFDAGAAQNLTVNVQSDAVVTRTTNGHIILVNSGSTVVNAGLIAQNSSSVFDGIRLAGSFNTVTNLGTIVVAGVNNFGDGITAAAPSNAITNLGSIAAAGTQVYGIWLLTSSASTAVNGGVITATGRLAVGIAVQISNDTRTLNTGTISALGQTTAGIEFATAVNNAATNLGVIRAAGVNSVAVAFDTGSTGTAFTNGVGGLIFAESGLNAVATGVQLGVGSGTGVLNNFGTIDGRMTAAGVNVVNAGLIQISTGTVGQAHAVPAFTQLAGGTLALRVNAAAAHDTLGVGGAATLGGTVRAVVQPGLYSNFTLVPNVVTSGVGLGGTQFANAVSTSPFFTASAAYGPGAVHLVLTRIPFGAVAGLTQNQQAIGNALEAAYSTAATGGAATIFGTILGGTTVPYDGLSGEVGTGVQNPTFALGDAFMGAISGQAQRWRAGMTGGAGTQSASGTYRVQFAAAQPSFELAESYAQAAAPGAAPWPPRSVGPHWAAWASGYGLSGNRNGDGTVGSARLGYSMGGGAFGADVQLNPNLLLGGAVTGAGSDFSLDGRSASGTARTIFFALYGSWTMGPLYVDATATYGLAQFSTTRLATLGSINERATGDFDGSQYGGRVEAGWRFMVQRYELTPFAGVTVQSLHQDGYSESSSNLGTGGAGILGLNYQAQSTTSVRSTLGAQAAATFQLGERTSLTPRVRAAWAHEFNDDRQVGASFLSTPAAAFTVNGARPARDAALVSAGVDVGLGRNVTVFAQFDSELSGSGNAYAGTGGLRVSW